MVKTLGGAIGMVVLVLAPVAKGNLGSIAYDLQSGGGDGPVFVSANGVTDATFPVSVSFTTAASGTSGSNRGASAVTFALVTGLPLIDQMPMMWVPNFVNAANAVSSTPGAGFDMFTSSGTPLDSTPLDLDPSLDQIDAVGGSQGFSPTFTTGTMGKQGPDLEFAGHFGPILIANGLIKVDKNTPAGTYILQVIGQNSSVWDHSAGAALHSPVPTSGDSLVLVVTPEPATLIMLGSVVLLAGRRLRRS
jgi:hypothetical protein